MTDLKKVLFLYRQSNISTQRVEEVEGSKLVGDVVEEGMVEEKALKKNESVTFIHNDI